jgi:hypothetical protein
LSCAERVGFCVMRNYIAGGKNAIKLNYTPIRCPWHRLCYLPLATSIDINFSTCATLQSLVDRLLCLSMSAGNSRHYCRGCRTFSAALNDSRSSYPVWSGRIILWCQGAHAQVTHAYTKTWPNASGSMRKSDGGCHRTHTLRSAPQAMACPPLPPSPPPLYSLPQPTTSFLPSFTQKHAAGVCCSM